MYCCGTIVAYVVAALMQYTNHKPDKYLFLTVLLATGPESVPYDQVPLPPSSA